MRSSRPESIWPDPILSLVGMCLIKKEIIQHKLEEGCLILRNNFMCRFFHFLYCTRDSVSAGVSSYRVSLVALIILKKTKKNNNGHLSC